MCFCAPCRFAGCIERNGYLRKPNRNLKNRRATLKKIERKGAMPEPHEKPERAEQVRHEKGHGSNKLFGVTVALIGVLIALSSAMLGSERNQLTRTMIEQTQAHSDYTSAS